MGVLAAPKRLLGQSAAGVLPPDNPPGGRHDQHRQERSEDDEGLDLSEAPVGIGVAQHQQPQSLRSVLSARA